MPKSRIRRTPLNPCDVLYLAHHRILNERGLGGNIALMVMEVEGEIRPERMRADLGRAMRVHPMTMGRLVISGWTGRAYWEWEEGCGEERAAAVTREGAGAAYVYEDLRGEADAEGKFEEIFQGRYSWAWDLERGPQVRLEQYAMPGGRTRLCLRWPHVFMDADGAMWFLREMGNEGGMQNSEWRIANAGEDVTGWKPVPQVAGEPVPQVGGMPEGLVADGIVVEPLAGRGWWARARCFVQGWRMGAAGRGMGVKYLDGERAAAFEAYRVMWRSWGGEALVRVRDRAKLLTPAGPARNARFFAACTIRALHRLYVERGARTEGYLLMIPKRVGIGRRRGPTGRPVAGNFLVAPTLAVRVEEVGDWGRIGETIARQLAAYEAAEGDQAQWAMAKAASWMRMSWYPVLFRLGMFRPSHSGFSYYGEVSRPVRRMGGCVVSNMWGGGPVMWPPGMNPVFSRFGERLNLSLTWNRPMVGDEMARRYVELIEEQILNSE